jgi:tetratricopeptide (TPR) repeat protein
VACFLQFAACKREPTPVAIAISDAASPIATQSSTIMDPVTSASAPIETRATPHPNDAKARAQGEYGFAKLREGKLDDAAESFADAIALDPNADIESQIEFNVGLLNDKRGDTERARAAYARADALHPSSAAKAKLAGRSRCGASVVRAPMLSGPYAGGMQDHLVTTSWRDVYAFAAERGTSLVGSSYDWSL